MLIGYVRVSKSDGTQTLEPQRDAMLAAGVDPTRIYEDLASGRHDARPGLIACLKAIQPGNTLVLWKLDRLGRDLRHLVNTVEDLRGRGVGLKVLTGAGAQIDTTTANGRLAFGIFAAFAEFERELIAERTMAGLAAARSCDLCSHLGEAVPSNVEPTERHGFSVVPRIAMNKMG